MWIRVIFWRNKLRKIEICILHSAYKIIKKCHGEYIKISNRLYKKVGYNSSLFLELELTFHDLTLKFERCQKGNSSSE